MGVWWSGATWGCRPGMVTSPGVRWVIGCVDGQVRSGDVVTSATLGWMSMGARGQAYRYVLAYVQVEAKALLGRRSSLGGHHA